jgi:hypothetical protein
VDGLPRGSGANKGRAETKPQGGDNLPAKARAYHAKIAALRKGEDESQSRARALREFMEQAIAAAEGDESAPLGPTGEPSEG